jgi:hypothetical protein
MMKSHRTGPHVVRKKKLLNMMSEQWILGNLTTALFRCQKNLSFQRTVPKVNLTFFW